MAAPTREDHERIMRDRFKKIKDTKLVAARELSGKGKMELSKALQKIADEIDDLSATVISATLNNTPTSNAELNLHKLKNIANVKRLAAKEMRKDGDSKVMEIADELDELANDVEALENSWTMTKDGRYCTTWDPTNKGTLLFPYFSSFLCFDSLPSLTFSLSHYPLSLL